jgi:2-dehydro-3-deoxyglucarate aldolase/4-hydroxy-2-oxoheptanedioate aldolase
MKINRCKERLQNGGTVFGCVLQHLRAAEIPALLAAGGFDFVFIDGEHGPFGLETIHDMVQNARRAGITPVVRVAELTYGLVARALDLGAEGIILPRVEDPVLLRQAVGWMRFPPQGTRGYGVSAARLDYEAASMEQVVAHVNANLLVVVQFESRTAIERCDELLAVPGIDVALVGPADLSISLGVPGQFEHPDLTESVSALVAACDRAGVAPGIQVRTLGLAESWLRRGMRFVGCGSEHGMLLEKPRETVAALRAAQPAP